MSWVAPFDPVDKKDYSILWADEMNATTDTIASATFTLPAAAIAAGMSVESQGVDVSGKVAFVWFRSTNTTLTQEIVGTKIAVDHTITTDGGRILNQTVWLKIKDN